MALPVAQIHAGGGRYLATTSETLEPAGNRVPGRALWEITVPRLLPFLCVRLTAPVAQCLALSVRLASASRLPLRDEPCSRQRAIWSPRTPSARSRGTWQTQARPPRRPGG